MSMVMPHAVAVLVAGARHRDCAALSVYGQGGHLALAAWERCGHNGKKVVLGNAPVVFHNAAQRGAGQGRNALENVPHVRYAEWVPQPLPWKEEAAKIATSNRLKCRAAFSGFPETWTHTAHNMATVSSPAIAYRYTAVGAGAGAYFGGSQS